LYEIIQKLLTPSKYNRPQTKLKQITKIALHYVGSAGGSAKAVNRYFEMLGLGRTYVSSKGTTLYKFASSHYIIGLEGEVIQNIPESEISYCTNAANVYSLSIEVCHPEWDGKYTEATYNTMVELCADLCIKHNLNPLTDLIRHFEITKKICPKWFVDNPNEWQIFKERVQALKDIKEGKYMETNIPQWKKDAVAWMLSVGIITSDHSPIEQLDMGTFAQILKNFVKIYKL
jgi:N-acetylmuramoyl-L-alanine amidase